MIYVMFAKRKRSCRYCGLEIDAGDLVLMYPFPDGHGGIAWKYAHIKCEANSRKQGKGHEEEGAAAEVEAAAPGTAKHEA